MLAAVKLLRPAAFEQASTPPYVHLDDHCTHFLLRSTGDEPDVRDGKDLRRLALALKVPIITTVAGAVATANALKGLRNKPLQHVRTVNFFAVTLLAAKHMCARVVTIHPAWDRAHHWSISQMWTI